MKTVDPAELLLVDGLEALGKFVAGSEASETHYAKHLLAKLGQDPPSPGAVEATIKEAAEVGFDRQRADTYLWPQLLGGLSTLGFEEKEALRLRQKHDETYAKQHGEQLLEGFATRLANLSVDECKQELIAATSDMVLLGALGAIEISEPGSASLKLAGVKVKRGCAGLVTALVNAGVQHARRKRKKELAAAGQLLARDSHVYLARRAQQILSYDGDADLRFDEGRLHRYEATSGVYEEVATHEVAQVVHALDGTMYERQSARGSFPAPLSVNASTVKGIKEILSEAEGIASPGFFAGRASGVAVENGVLVVDEDGAIQLRPHSPEYRIRHRIAVTFDSEAQAPRWGGALDQWFDGARDAGQRKRLLAQFVLATLFASATIFQRALFLLGGGGTGKSTCLKIVKSLFPPSAVCSIDPQEISHEYAAAELAGKLLNVGFDMSAQRMEESAGFKKAVVGDLMTGRFPFEPRFSFEPFAGHMYALNAMPQTRERTSAIWDRVVVLEFPNDFRNDPVRREVALDQYIIEHEQAGVLAWAVREGGGVFRDRMLSIPPSSHEAIRGWTSSIDAVATWFTEVRPKITFDGDAIENLERHYHRFRFWAVDFGFFAPNLNTFRERIHQIATPAVAWVFANFTVLEAGPNDDLRALARANGVSASSLRRKYNAHAKANGLEPLNATAFGRQLQAHFTKVKSGKTYYLLTPTAGAPSDDVDAATVVAIDTETELITADEPVPTLICLSYHDNTGNDGVLGPRDAIDFVRDLLARGTLIVGHNIAFDLAVLVRAADDPDFERAVFAAYRAGRVTDTGVREALIRCAEGTLKTSRFKLSALVSKYVGLNISESKGPEAIRMRYGELAGVPVDDWPEVAIRYALDDARYTLRVWEGQGGVTSPVPNESEQAVAAWALYHLHVVGICVDQGRVTKLEAALRSRMDALREALPFFENGKKKLSLVRARVESCFPDGDVPRTDNKAVKVGADVLRATNDPDLLELVEFDRAQKLLSTFVSKLVGVDAVRGSYEVLKKTGRTSCSGPNLQQLPGRGGVRECFGPRLGFALIAADYGTIELRSHAQVLLDWFGESALAETLRSDVDLHLALAATILGIEYAEAAQRRQKHDPEIEEARTLAKAANFGFPGGLSPAKFVAFARDNYGIELTPERAAQLKNAWHRRYPEMRRYFSRVSSIVDDRRQLLHERSGRVQGGATFTEAANAHFQALASDGAKRALALVVEESRVDPTSALYGTNVLVFVHDEIIIEAPIDRVHEAAERLEELMIAGMAHYIPDVPIVVEAKAMDRWSKEARRLVVDDKLQVWSPSTQETV